jgi:hypothetical protein
MHGAGGGLPSWIEAAGTLLTGLATVLAGIAALRGLNAWRRETVGRRKAELAEEVLAQFYLARDILAWARFPIGETSPDAAPPRRSGESEHDALEKQRIYGPVGRLAQESQIFSELQASRYRFMAYFGEEASKPFDEIRRLQAEVIAAADKLIRAQGRPDSAETLRDRDGWESTIGWGAADQDHIAHRLERVMRDIESVCRPLIDERAGAPHWPSALPGVGLRRTHARRSER